MGTIDRMSAAAASMVKAGSDEDAAEVGDVSSTDAVWAAMTIAHHRSGIALAELALERASSQEVRAVAEVAKKDQEEDLPVLEQLISAAGRAPMPPDASIESMEKEHMSMLSSMSGKEFDTMWLDVFRSHHMSAILTGDVAMAGSTSPVAKRLLMSMRTSQLGQLKRMNALSEDLHG